MIGLSKWPPSHARAVTADERRLDPARPGEELNILVSLNGALKHLVDECHVLRGELQLLVALDVLSRRACGRRAVGELTLGGDIAQGLDFGPSQEISNREEHGRQHRSKV
jgi:hypothetical protein